MTDNAFPFLSSDWLKVQERYWQAWNDMTRFTSGASGARAAASQPWSQAMDQWWTAVSPALSSPVQNFFGHLVDQGKSFFGLSENLFSGILDASKAATSGADWQRLLEKSFADLKTAAGATLPDSGSSLGKMLAFWELPMDTWERTMSVMSGVPGDFMQPLKTLTSQQQAPVREQLNKFLSVPGVGYAREHQSQYQKLMQLYMDYQTAFDVYSAEYTKIGNASVERFQSKVTEAIGSDKPIDSMQSLFNLWVDACEEAYADQVSSDEYAKVYGRLVNSLMAFKKQGQALADETLGLLSIPTREDITTLQQRYQMMRRELRDIHERIDQLEQQPPAHPAASAAPAAPRRKTAGTTPRKKAVAKKTVVRRTRATGSSREDKS